MDELEMNNFCYPIKLYIGQLKKLLPKNDFSHLSLKVVILVQ